jgi:alternate signal-mediated exported protein
MNKLTKGAIASAAGIILLMGGAGTLASWNAAGTVTGGQTISSGTLSVATPTAGVWKSGTNVIDPTTFKIVPGDVLTFTQNFALTASGNNLLFTVAGTAGAISAVNSASTFDTQLATKLTNLGAFSASGTNISTSTTPGTYKVTSNSGTSTVTVVETISFPYGTAGDNTTQGGNVTLGAGAVTLTQTTTP